MKKNNKRCSLKFKICNFLYRDSLRKYLAIDQIAIMGMARTAEENGGRLYEWQIRKLHRIAEDLEWIMTDWYVRNGDKDGKNY